MQIVVRPSALQFLPRDACSRLVAGRAPPEPSIGELAVLPQTPYCIKGMSIKSGDVKRSKKKGRKAEERGRRGQKVKESFDPPPLCTYASAGDQNFWRCSDKQPVCITACA